MRQFTVVLVRGLSSSKSIESTLRRVTCETAKEAEEKALLSEPGGTRVMWVFRGFPAHYGLPTDYERSAE